MNRLIVDIKNGEIDKVVIHNLDRLTRRVKDLIRIIELFDEHDVELVSIKEKVETKTAMGRFFIMIIILIAQWEQETNSERTKRGLDQSALEGNYSKGGLAPFGYVKTVKLVEHGFQKWETMSYNRKREFLLSHVKKIIIDMKEKEVVNIQFLNLIQNKEG